MFIRRDVGLSTQCDVEERARAPPEFRYWRSRRWQPSLERRPTSEARPGGGEAGGRGLLEAECLRNTLKASRSAKMLSDMRVPNRWTV